MKYTNLAQSPVYYTDTIRLIEKSFNYSANNKFDIDFYPLMSKDNHKNNHLIIIDNKLAAHIGVLIKTITINKKDYPIAMYGGIAVDESYRGKGIFKNLFNYVLDQYKDVSIHLLWSDQLEMYEKFGFFPAIEQYEYNQSLEDADGFVPCKLEELNSLQIQSLKELYDNQNDIRINRSDKDWEVLKNITSTNLYIKKEKDKVQNYFFINKGEDLNGVIIEVGSFCDIDQIKNFGITWAPKNYINALADTLYGAVVKIGNESLFSDFIHNYTNNIINNVTVGIDTIKFNFEKNSFEIKSGEFLTGILGPGKFEELKELPPIYISGLDSI